MSNTGNDLDKHTAASARRARIGRRVTARDIARSLGVSISTVSRAFTNDAVIKPATRDRVLAEARRLGYTPDSLARGLITRRSSIAGIAVADITNPFYPEVLATLTRRLHESGLQSMVFFAGPGRQVDEALPTLLQYNPDVAVILAATLSSETIRTCEQAGTPVVLFNRYVNNTDTLAISCDNLGGGRLVADTFLDAGYQRLAYISGLPDTSTNRDRLKGFSERIREREGDPPLVEDAGSFSYESGFNALKRLMDRRPTPEAVFCANDIVAIGALDAAKVELGMKIPRDLSVIGFDDISMAAWPPYSLTTVRQPANAMVNLTLEKIECLLTDSDYQPEQLFVPGRLIQRTSARLGESL